MKITINAKEFQDEIKFLAESAGGIKPVLHSVLIEAKDGKIRLSSTNLERSAASVIEGAITSDGIALVPAKPLIAVVAMMRDDIHISVSDVLMTLTCGKQKYEINLFGTSDYPIFNDFDGPEIINLPGSEFKQILSSVLKAAGKDNSGNITQCSVMMKFSETKIELTATDVHCLCFVELKKACSGAASAQLRTSDAEAVKNMIQNCDLKILHSQNKIRFISGNRELTCLLVEARYPDFSRVLCKEYKYELQFDTESIVTAINAIKPIARDRFGLCQVSITPLMMTLSAKSDEGSAEISEPITANFEMIFNLNCGFFLNALSTMSEKCFLRIVSNVDPILFCDESTKFIIMPMSVK